MHAENFRHDSTIAMRRLSAFFLTAVVSACTVWLFIMASNSARKDTAANSSPKPAPGENARGVRTSVVRDNRVALRASADEITVRRPKAFGPFRIGFLRSVRARGVAVETFEEPHERPRRLESAPAVIDSLAHLLPGTDARRVAKAEVEGLRFTRYMDGQATFALQARRCETTAIPKGLRCTGGLLRAGGSAAHFKTAVFSDGVWRVDGQQWFADQRPDPDVP